MTAFNIPGLDNANALAQAAIGAQRGSDLTAQQKADLSAAQRTGQATVATASAPASNKAPSDYSILVQGQKGSNDYDQGSTLLGLLTSGELPAGVRADTEFAWAIDKRRSAPNAPIYGPYAPGAPNPNENTLTEMTMAGALSWLRNLSVNNPDAYSSVVHELVAAQYLSPSAARYGSYTTSAAVAFLKSAADVYAINQDAGNGQVTTWQDHIDQLVRYGQLAGQVDANGLPLSSGGGGGGGGAVRLAPTRQDVWTSKEDVTAAANSAAHNLLGRNLSQSELSAIYDHFHSLESSYNNQKWAYDQQNFNGGGSASITQPPSPAAASKNFVDTDPSLAADRTQQLVGSYLGVLGNMVGLGGANGGFGSGGVSSAVA